MPQTSKEFKIKEGRSHRVMSKITERPLTGRNDYSSRSNFISDEINSQQSSQFNFDSQVAVLEQNNEKYKRQNNVSKHCMWKWESSNSNRNQLLQFNQYEEDGKDKLQEVYKDEYNAMYHNFISQFNSQSNEKLQKEGRKHLLSCILKMVLKNNKEFNCENNTNRKKDKSKKTNAKGNNTVLAKISKQNISTHNNVNSLQYAAQKYESYSSNIFKLIPSNYHANFRTDYDTSYAIYQISINKLLTTEYLNQMIQQNYRRNKIYGADDSKEVLVDVANLDSDGYRYKLKIEEDYIKYKELNNKFIEHLVKNMKIYGNKSNGRQANGNECQIQRGVLKVCISLFNEWINSEIPSNIEQIQVIRNNKMRPAWGNRKVRQDLGKEIEMKMIVFVSDVQIKWGKVREEMWNVEDKEESKEMKLLEKQLESFGKNKEQAQKQANINVQEECRDKIQRQFQNIVHQYFIKSQENCLLGDDPQSATHPCTCPYFLSAVQLEDYLCYLNQIQSKMSCLRNKQLCTKITGKMIYQAENEIDRIKNRQQAFAKIVVNIIEKNQGFQRNKSNIDKIKRNSERNYPNYIEYEGHRTNKLEESRVNEHKISNQNHSQIELIKKIKTQSSKLLNNSNGIPNGMGSNVYYTRNKNYSYIMSNPNSNSISSYNHNDIFINNPNILYKNNKTNPLLTNSVHGRSNSKNKKSKDTKKIQIENYINKYDSKEESISTRLDMHAYKKSKLKATNNSHNIKSNNMSDNQEPVFNLKKSNAVSNKIIKYSKYPIQFNTNVYFNSDSYSDCTIVYHIESIHIKELTLTFFNHRRRYTVNKVKIIVPQGIMNPNSVNTDVALLNKTIRAMQVLCCLGATVTIEEQRPYANPHKIQNINVQVLSFAMGENIQKTWQMYSKWMNEMGMKA